MKRFKFFLFCLFIFAKSNSQETSKLSTINLSVILPSNADGLNESNLSKLENKIIEAVTNNGVSADGYTQNFVIYPKFEIYDEKESKGGLRNIKIINCNLSLFIKQLSTNIIFSTYSKNIQGSGYNKNEAINNAMSSIDPADPKIMEFVNNGKQKIIQYYQINCETIIRKAEAEKNIKNYECSLSILLSIPEEVPNCNTKAVANAKIVFLEFQKSQCEQYLQKAIAASAALYYDEALEYLSYIDPSGPCTIESKKLISVISSKVDADRKAKWDFLLKTYSDAVALKKLQLIAMNNLAIGWLKSQPSAATYITIVK
ncbi:MAG: hypothetical protein SFU87_18200 [Chitinophagaceae bacterium]|nr:hypothetical protein [Chitinophagaceae bacterium]